MVLDLKVNILLKSVMRLISLLVILTALLISCQSLIIEVIGNGLDFNLLEPILLVFLQLLLKHLDLVHQVLIIG